MKHSKPKTKYEPQIDKEYKNADLNIEIISRITNIYDLHEFLNTYCLDWSQTKDAIYAKDYSGLWYRMIPYQSYKRLRDQKWQTKQAIVDLVNYNVK